MGTSTVMKDYAVIGIPKIVLIDHEGKIAFSGHPASRIIV